MQSTEFDLDLDWRRDTKGYSLAPAETLPASRDPDLAKIQMFRDMPLGAGLDLPERITRAGGEFAPIRPTAEDPYLYLKFSQVKTAQELLAFINTYGFLTKHPFGDHDDDHDETVADALRWAQQMRDVIQSKADGALGRSSGTILDFKRLSASLVADRFTGQLKFQFKATNLLDALWFQLGKALLNNSINKCLQCGVPFPAGIGAGRRSDAKFCSDAHREAFKSRKRSQKDAQP